ncbi:CehA/McbA family metallohydrolase [Alicyclobacillus fastidiosus]|uniref:CehA/McbA family metallohydrolase n=1 Tax=Alicyclobacillus fastidiosus TaxID=392011 RepID=A0ABV5AA08_9BACL|nr:CehA/McbA family metallohydrolase [Alicyclobacillus fastidiosus]WEH07748.1 CehA/McbA family metallohydrolase [Alicyclobacillus fastidiosus]
MMSVLHLSTDVTEQDTGGFLELPFDVPNDIYEICITINVTPQAKEPCIIDVGLCDPAQVRGWSGSTKYDLRISLDDATPGYLAGDLPTGRWAILLGLYVIGKSGAHVDATVTLVKASRQWLQGDLHVHTLHSDGAYTLSELDEIAMRNGLDFIGLTDHNTTSQNYLYPRDSSVTYIPAMELTTYRGHANLFGIPTPCDDFRVQVPADVIGLLQEAKRRGARISVNHPYDDGGPSCQWQWGYDVPFDWLEVWNGPWRPSNEQSVALWQIMLAQGRRVIAVAGSDTHREHPYVRHGYPTTYVYASSKRASDILSAIDAGHASFSYCPNGPRIELSCGLALMGDEVGASDAAINVHIEGVEPKDVVVVITEDGEVERHEVIERGDWTTEVRKAPTRFVRAELWRYFAEVDGLRMAALSNPIFFTGA